MNNTIGAWTGLFGLLLPLSAIVLGMGIAFWSIYWDHQKKRLQYQERQLMIERGMTPPPDLPNEPKLVTPEQCLRRGTVWLFLGMGLGAAYFLLGDTTIDDDFAGLLGVAGLIVGFLGLGNLTYYFLAKDQTPAQKSEA